MCIYISETCRNTVMLDLHEGSKVALEDIVDVVEKREGSGRQILRRAGLHGTNIEILSIPPMLFSDDMNAGRSKVFSKMDNIVLVLPSIPNLCNGKKSRHHLESS